MKNLLKIGVISALLVGSTYASDLLLSITNGKVSDGSVGVRVLSLDEMKQVKGGYLIQAKHNNVNEYYVIARYTTKEYEYILNYAYNRNGPRGLCGIGQDDCTNPSSNRIRDFLYMTNNYIDFFPLYSVKRNIGTTNRGDKFVYFTYGVGIADAKGQIYKINSSAMLNNNMIIKEMSAKYKEQMEYALGGWSVK